MRDPRARHVAEPREVGVVANLAPIHHVLELDRKGHEPGNSGNSRSASRARNRLGLPAVTAFVATWAHWQRRLDLDGPVLPCWLGGRCR